MSITSKRLRAFSLNLSIALRAIFPYCSNVIDLISLPSEKSLATPRNVTTAPVLRDEFLRMFISSSIEKSALCIRTGLSFIVKSDPLKTAALSPPHPRPLPWLPARPFPRLPRPYKGHEEGRGNVFSPYPESPPPLTRVFPYQGLFPGIRFWLRVSRKKERGPLCFFFPLPVAASSAFFFDEFHPFNRHGPVNRLAHIIDCKKRHGNSAKGLHFNPCFSFAFHRDIDVYMRPSVWSGPVIKAYGNARERYWMAHGYQVRRAFCRHNG